MNILSELNKPSITFMVFAALIALAIYSQQERMASHDEYTSFINSRLAEHRTSRERAIMDVWNIGEEEIAKPVLLWGVE